MTVTRTLLMELLAICKLIKRCKQKKEQKLFVYITSAKTQTARESFFLPSDFACRDFDICDLLTASIRSNNIKLTTRSDDEARLSA